MKPSERLEHWEDLSPMEFVALRREVAQLESDNVTLQRLREQEECAGLLYWGGFFG